MLLYMEWARLLPHSTLMTPEAGDEDVPSMGYTEDFNGPA